MARPKPTGPKKPKNLVGERVRQARLAHRPALDQTDLAELLTTALGLTYGRTTVVRLENRTRHVTDVELVTLSRILGVDVYWLLYGDPASGVERQIEDN